VSPDQIAAHLHDLGAGPKGIQRAAAEALGSAVAEDPGLRDRLLQELGGSDPRRRWGAAFALSCGEAPPAEIVPVLVETLASADGDLRWAAARILVRMIAARGASRDVLIPIIGAASPPQRKMALYCLRELGPDPSLGMAPIVNALEDEDRDVRLAALATGASLGRGDPDVARALARRLADADRGVARAAAAAVGRLGVDVPDVRAALDAARRGSDADLSRAATEALSRLDGTALGGRPPVPPRPPE
jgi:HEAT repeat protein